MLKSKINNELKNTDIQIPNSIGGLLRWFNFTKINLYCNLQYIVKSQCIISLSYKCNFIIPSKFIKMIDYCK